MGKRYSIYSSTFTDGTTPISLVQVRSTSVQSGSRKSLITPGGAVDRGAIVLSHAEPVIRLETGDLATALAGISATTGYNASSGATLRAQQRSDGGVFLGAGNHVTVTSSKGFLLPESLSARQDDEQGAALSLLYYPLSSTGLAAPLTVTASQNLANSPAYTSLFYLGPVYHNGSALPGILGVEIDFGLMYSVVRHDGDVYAREGTIVMRNPSFRISMAELDAAPDLFNAALAGVLAIYLRKGSPGGSRVADATTSHVKVSCATGAWSTTDKSVAGLEADWAANIEALPTGTITVSAASAIP